MSGLEFNTPGISRKTSGHLLALDLRAPVAPSLEVPELIAQIQGQGALAVAAWKTLLRCKLHQDAIKECIRCNEQVAMIFYQDGLNADNIQIPSSLEEPDQRGVREWRDQRFCNKL